jgi:anti-anti-sigma regulatory factor
VQIVNDETSGVCRVLGPLGIGEVAELRERLCSAWAKTPSLVLDLSGVDSCDTSAIQLLYSARKTADTAKHIQFVGLSGAITEAASALGLAIGELTAEEAVPSAPANEANPRGI